MRGAPRGSWGNWAPDRLIAFILALDLARVLTRRRNWLGRLGEYLASRELERRGYRIVARRVRSRWGEIDIVAFDGPVLVFVEVKTRRSERFGRPAEAVSFRKQRKLAQLAHLYQARRSWHHTRARFDVVSVLLLPRRRPDIEVIRGAFLA